MYYKYYLMTDINDKNRNFDWIIMTDCPRNRVQLFATMSHKLCAEGYVNYEGMDFSDCGDKSDYFIKLMEYNGYECRVIDFDMIEWRDKTDEEKMDRLSIGRGLYQIMRVQDNKS